MKTNSVLSCLLLCLLGLSPARAVLIETHNFNGLNLVIPDGSPSGLANVQNFPSAISLIADVNVHISLVGNPLAFNGDSYVYLTHGTGFSVLLNRVGRTAGNLFGYADDGIDITLDDSAVNGDVHNYGGTTTPAPGSPLTGIWSPDGRITNPNSVLNTDPRTAFLSSFNGLSASGDWTLFVADVSSGQQQKLTNWSLTITGDAAVPEPGTALFGLALLGATGFSRRRSSR